MHTEAGVLLYIDSCLLHRGGELKGLAHLLTYYSYMQLLVYAPAVSIVPVMPQADAEMDKCPPYD